MYTERMTSRITEHHESNTGKGFVMMSEEWWWKSWRTKAKIDNIRLI